MEQRILVILPHPDDESFGIAGSLAMHIQNGAQVTYACLTSGEMGRNMGNPPFASRVTLPGIRKLELEQSCEAIGIQDLRMLGLHDKTIEFEDQDKLDGLIQALLEELNPTLVYSFYPGYSVHPDHDASGAAVIRTIGRMPKEQRPPVHCVAFANNLVESIGEPNLLVDVREFLPQKVASIKAHRSQFNMDDMLGQNASNRVIEERFGTERFWIYPFKS